MATYLVTGASRGLGFEFINQLSRDDTNTVIGMARSKAATENKVRKELGERKNLHIVEGDLSDYKSLSNAFSSVSDICGGKLDYLIANAALTSDLSGWRTFGSLSKTPEALEKDLMDSFHVNVVGNIHLFNTYLPLILKGTAKKVVHITTGHADLDLVPKLDLANAPTYTVSKSAMNMAVAKFSAEYKKQGLLFESIAPGVIDTGSYQGDMNDEIKQVMTDTFTKFAQYAPHFKGPSPIDVAVRDVLKTVHESSIERGHAGAFMSQYGNKQWL